MDDGRDLKRVRADDNADHNLFPERIYEVASLCRNVLFCSSRNEFVSIILLINC